MLDEIEVRETEITKENIKLQLQWDLRIFFIDYYLSSDTFTPNLQE